MLDISNRAKGMQASATLQLSAKVAEMIQSGKDIIKLNVGEPDFDTPSNIKEACIRALHEGKTRYAPASGIIELREAIGEKLMKDNQVIYDSQEISYSTGSKQALFNVLSVLINFGDEIIIPTPCYVSYIPMIKLCGGVPVLVPGKEENGFALDVAAIKAVVTENTKAIIINTPNNPTGAVYDKESLTALADLAIYNDFYIISDEVYEKIIYGEKKHFCIASISDDVKNISFIVNGFSKSYAMTGWRAGYVAGPAKIISKIDELQGHSISNSCTPVQWACIEALRGPQDELHAMVAEFDKRRKYITNRLNRAGFTCWAPNGAFYIMPNISGLLNRKYLGESLIDSNRVADFLLEEAHIAVVPGSAFESPDHIRISYSNSLENIKRAIDLMEAALLKLE